MKIIRHTARDMRQAMRGIREQLGEDAVILSSRRTAAGVEVTAAVELDASTLEAQGFATAPLAVPGATPAAAIATPTTCASGVPAALPVQTAPAPAAAPGLAAFAPTVSVASSAPVSAPAAAAAPALGDSLSSPFRVLLDEPELISRAAREAVEKFNATATRATDAATVPSSTGVIGPTSVPAPPSVHASASVPASPSLHASASVPVSTSIPASPNVPASTGAPAPAATAVRPSYIAPRTAAPTLPEASPIDARQAISAPTLSAAPTEVPLYQGEDPVQQAFATSLLPFGTVDAEDLQTTASSVQVVSPTDAMGHELKTLRRMLETQLAQLAWNDLTRRAPIHTEILRELTEIGITQELAELLIRQLPHDTDLTFARRFAIAGLSQYLRVTGDRWLDHGGRIAFVGSTGVGKTTTLAKVAVRWVLRHGPRDIALLSADCVRIGAQDQLQSLAQLLGVPAYTVDNLDALPSVLDRVNERLILIDTPGASLRDPQLSERLAPLADRSLRIDTALVLAASTQAGALEDAVARFEPANPACCVLTKLDEAASLGGALSVLIRARLPVAYLSEGQRVPEDLRPARALELVSSAVQLAKTSGAAADEDLLRRRFGRTAHAFT